MNRSDDDDQPEGLQLDIYGIKVNVKPAHVEDFEPKTWQEVWLRVNRELRGLIVNVFGVLNDALKTTRSLLKGIGSWGQHRSREITIAHAKADLAEAQAQEAVVCSSGDPRQALRNLERLVSRKQAEGLSMKVFSDGDRLVVLALPPVDEQALENLAKEVIAEMNALLTTNDATDA